MDKEIPQYSTYHEGVKKKHLATQTRYSFANVQRLSLVSSHVWGRNKLQSRWMSGNGGDVWKSYQDRGVEYKASVCDIWSRAAAQKYCEGVGTFAEAMSGSIVYRLI